MHESKFESGLTTAEIEQKLRPEGSPTDAELLIISLLSRIYDAQMELLGHFDKKQAKDLWNIHNSGGSKNPMMFVPDIRALEQEVEQ